MGDGDANQSTCVSRCLQFFHEGQDLFRASAAMWFHKAVDDVTDVERQQVKQLVYGILYGISCFEVAKCIGIPISDAMRVMETFKRTFSGLTAFTEAIVRAARGKGYVQTMFGRRRYLPAINASAPPQRNRAERQAVNSTIQVCD